MEDNTALNIYTLSVILIDELDKCEGTNLFRQKFKYHAKGLIKEIENFDSSVAELTEANTMNEFINDKRGILL